MKKTKKEKKKKKRYRSGQESPYTICTALFPERLRSGDKRTARGGGAALHAGPEGGPQQHVWSQVPRSAPLRSRGHGEGPQGPVAHPQGHQDSRRLEHGRSVVGRLTSPDKGVDLTAWLVGWGPA